MTIKDIQTPEYSKTYMDERKPLGKGRVASSKTPNGSVQRSCSLPITRPCAVLKQLLVYVPCHTLREVKSLITSSNDT
jgi:hypothetical protein